MDLRRIDALVAEKVMGWTCYLVGKVGSDYWYPEGETPRTAPFRAGAIPVEVFAPSTDIASAWHIVDREGSHNLWLRSEHGLWSCAFDGGPEVHYIETAELAICLAALKAKGIDPE